MRDPKPNEADLDPQDAIESDDYDDPTPDPIEDPDHPDFVVAGVDYSSEETAR